MLGADEVVGLEEPSGDASGDEIDSGVVSGICLDLARLKDPSKS